MKSAWKDAIYALVYWQILKAEMKPHIIGIDRTSETNRPQTDGSRAMTEVSNKHGSQNGTTHTRDRLSSFRFHHLRCLQHVVDAFLSLHLLLELLVERAVNEPG